MLSSIAAGNTSQTTSVQIMHSIPLNKLSMCNFDFCKSITCYMVCINNKVNNSTGKFWLLDLGFPSFLGASLFVTCTMLYYVISSAFYGNKL